MQGKLLINLDPPYVYFESENKVSMVNQCTRDAIRDLLMDLNLISDSYTMPNTEFVARVSGDFSSDVLSKHLLTPVIIATDPFRSVLKVSRLAAAAV